MKIRFYKDITSGLRSSGVRKFGPAKIFCPQRWKIRLLMQETWVPSPGREDPWRTKWQPSPIFLPGEAHGEEPGRLYPRGFKETDTTEGLKNRQQRPALRATQEPCPKSKHFSSCEVLMTLGVLSINMNVCVQQATQKLKTGRRKALPWTTSNSLSFPPHPFWPLPESPLGQCSEVITHNCRTNALPQQRLRTPRLETRDRDLQAA